MNAISLDALVANPGTLAELPSDAIAGVLSQIAALNSALAARLLHPADGRPAASTPDMMLSIEDAATRIHESSDWIKRHAKKLPFVRRISRKKFLVSEQALTRWLASRKA